MYLNHFRLKELPFSLTPNTEFYCELISYQEALNVLLVSLHNGEGFIKVVGEVGVGKTLLCRKLLDELGEQFVTAYLPNPDLTPNGLCKALAQELSMDLPNHLDAYSWQSQINQKLIDLNRENKRVVFIIDEAQAMSNATLERLRLLTNLETPSKKLLQIVLFGQPELNQTLSQVQLRQLRQRITFCYHVSPLKYDEMINYLNHRLATAGYTYGSLFTRHAQRLLFNASQGIPRIVNILCHKAMLSAYGRNKYKIDAKAMRHAIKDSEINIVTKSRHWGIMLSLSALYATLFILYRSTG